MKYVYIVINGAENQYSRLQFAFHNRKEAEKFKDYLDSKKGASSTMSTICPMLIYDAAIQLMKQETK